MYTSRFPGQCGIDIIYELGEESLQTQIYEIRKLLFHYDEQYAAMLLISDTINSKYWKEYQS